MPTGKPCGILLCMTLEQYLARYRISPAEFARLMGVPQSTVSRILKRQRRPTLTTYAMIRKASGGKVRMEDMLKPSNGKAKKAR